MTNTRLTSLGFTFKAGYWSRKVGSILISIDSEKHLTLTQDMTTITVGFFDDINRLECLLIGLDNE